MRKKKTFLNQHAGLLPNAKGSKPKRCSVMEKACIKDALELDREFENDVARTVVMALSRGDILLQKGQYLTREDVEVEREYMRNYQFRFPSRQNPSKF